MKLTSRASDYALLLLTYLAEVSGREIATVRRAAEELGISSSFLGNITNKLAVARLIISHRGMGGGIRLSRPAAAISVRAVMEAIDGPLQAMFCQNTTELCDHERCCHMKSFWDELQSDVIERLEQTTIADFVARTQAVKGALKSDSLTGEIWRKRGISLPSHHPSGPDVGVKT